MVDIFDKAKRSDVMSHVRGRGNRNTEIVFLNLLRSSGISGWRRDQLVDGKPDFVFRVEKVAVFIDGCFWHGCPKHSSFPVSNRTFWKKKLVGNKERDRSVSRLLKRDGWRVLRIWQCELAKNPDACVAKLLKLLELGGDESAPFR